MGKGRLSVSVLSEALAVPVLAHVCGGALRGGPSAILVDLDGTISPIALDPSQAFVLAGVRRALGQLLDKVDVVAVLSGRTPDVARAMVGLDGLEYFGLHGAARWTPSGTELAHGLIPFVDTVRRLEPLVRERFDGLAVRIEVKGSCLAVHYRGVDRPRRVRSILTKGLASLAREAGMTLLDGRMVLELRPPGVGKGRCVTRLAEERALNGVVCIGDDQTDAEAFAAVRAWREAGAGRQGVAIAVGSAEAPRTLLANADYLLRDVAAVEAFLNELAKVLGGGPT